MIHWHIAYYQSLVSTQSHLKSLAKDVGEGTVIVAEVQEAGVGRKGDVWLSQQGGLYCSFILKPNQLLNELPLILLSTLHGVLCEIAQVDLQVKWPNDILHRGAKLSGLLIDSQITGNHPDHYICGFGINVNQKSFSPELKACSLTQLRGSDYSIGGLLSQVLTAFQESYHHYLLNKKDFCEQIVSVLPWLEYNEHIEKWKV